MRNRHSNRHTSGKRSARCVQRFDDSLDVAIRMTYRISLRSSSLWEPRHPLLNVLGHCLVVFATRKKKKNKFYLSLVLLWSKKDWFVIKWWLIWLLLQWMMNSKQTVNQSIKLAWSFAGQNKWNELIASFIHSSSFYVVFVEMIMILPQVHLRKPCYDFTFL